MVRLSHGLSTAFFVVVAATSISGCFGVLHIKVARAIRATHWAPLSSSRDGRHAKTLIGRDNERERLGGQAADKVSHTNVWAALKIGEREYIDRAGEMLSTYISFGLARLNLQTHVYNIESAWNIAFIVKISNCGDSRRK